MLLLVDAGNTRIKWALLDRAAMSEVEPGRWVTSGSVAREQVTQLEGVWRTLDISRAIFSNVAGQIIQDKLGQILSHALGVKQVNMEWFVSLPLLAGVRNGYRQPHQLGCDRFASAIGGRALFPDQPLIIATCGTATTIDAVAADGFFSGGMILPGLSLMACSLAGNTAQLAQAQLPQFLQLNTRLSPFADNTEEAIISGCIAAQVGVIERAFAVHARMNGGEFAQCIVSGGAAATIAAHLAIPYTQVENLVLIGLQIVAQLH